MDKPEIAISLRTKLIIAMAGMALIPLFFTNLISLRTAQQSIMKIVFERNRNFAENIASDIDQMFAEKIRLMKIAVDSADIKSMDAERLVQALRPIPVHHSELLMAIVLAPNGDLLARSDGKQIKANYSDREYFHTATRTGVTTISDVLVSKTTGNLDIGIAEPIKNSDQTLRGILVIGVALQKIIDRIAETRIGTTGYAYVVNKNGKVLMHPDHNLVEQATDFSGLAPVQAALSGKTGWVEYELYGRKALAGYSYVPTTGWGLIVQQPLDEAMIAATTLRNTNIIIMLVTVLIAIVIVFALAGVLFKPIALLTAAAGKVAGGDLTVQASFQSSDEIGALAAAFNNMTTQLRARDKALQQSQEEYRQIVDTSNEGIWVFDKNRQTTFVNVRMAEMLGYQKEEMIGREMESFIFDEDMPDHRQQMEVRHQGIGAQYERRLEHRDGHAIWTIVSATPILDAMNHFAGSFGMITDISKRKQAEDATRDSEKRYRSIMEASPDPTVTYDMQGNVIYINPAFTRVFGWTFDDVVGTKIDYVPEETKAETQAMLDRLNKGDSFSGFQTQRYDKNRNIIDIDMSFGVWKTQAGIPAGSVVILRDVTLQKKLEAHLQRTQKLETIGTLAAGIAHDFNNILSGIFGFSELAKMHLDTPERAEQDIDQVLNAGQKAKDLVQQILTISRKSTNNKKPTSVSDVVKEVISLLRVTLPTTIQIKETIATKAMVMADPTKIHQVIMNLGTNAYHAMQEKGGVLAVGLKEIVLSRRDYVPELDLAPGRYIKIEVSDTGHGMDSITLGKIFDPYFTTKEPGKGTGLGLAVVLGIVEEHKGAVRIYSESGCGSTFHVYLPIIEKAVAADIISNEPDTPVFGSETILLVDDDAAIVKSTQEFLTESGYTVYSFSTGSEAFKIYKKNPYQFDLLITDFTMPGMTGIEFALKVFELRRDQPVILCTGLSESINREKAIAMGITEYLEKPMTTREIAKVIRAVLDGRQIKH